MRKEKERVYSYTFYYFYGMPFKNIDHDNYYEIEIINPIYNKGIKIKNYNCRNFRNVNHSHGLYNKKRR